MTHIIGNTLKDTVDLYNKTSYVFDIETDGFYNDCTKIYCIVLKDINTGTIHKFGEASIETGIACLMRADYIIGHNIIDFDIRVIKKLYTDLYKLFKGVAIDTLVMSKQLFHNRALRDTIGIRTGILDKETFKIYDKNKEKLVSAVGRHSLASWGLRLEATSTTPSKDMQKGSFGDNIDWATIGFSKEMLEYCVQDVEVNYQLLLRLLESKEENEVPWEALLLEFHVQSIISQQQTHGWLFNTDKAESLYASLCATRVELRGKLQEAFKGYDEVTKTPRLYKILIPVGEDRVAGLHAKTKGELSQMVWDTYKDYKDSVTGKKMFTRVYLNSLIEAGPLKVIHHPFNPGSSVDIHRELSNKYGWTPTEFNETDGKAKCGVAILKQLEYEEAEWLVELETVQDRLEKLAEGRAGGYLTFMRESDGRLHGYVNTLGAASNRATHSKPNLGQVPASRVPYGEEFRDLFIVPRQYKLVGADQSAIEMCILAHYLYKYDDGDFMISVTEGDPHTRNQEASGVATRDDAKVLFYSIVYGAGAPTIAKALGVSIARAAKMKANLLKGLPALKKLINKCESDHSELGSVRAIDGRLLYTRQGYSALNMLIQGSAAVTAKLWMYFIDLQLSARGLQQYVHQLGWIHDEVQLEVAMKHPTIDNLPEEVGKICQEAIISVGEYLDLKCPVKAEYKIGDSWKHTH